MAEAAHLRRARRDAYDQLRDELLDQLKGRSLDPANEAHAQPISDLAADVVERYQREARTGLGGLALANPPDMVGRLIRSVLNWGVLTDLLERRDVEEIFIKGGDVWYQDSAGRLRNIEEPTTEGELRQIVNRLLRTAGRTVDQRVPMVQTQVLGGRARLGVVIPPISDALSATIRKYTLRNETLDVLVEWGSLTRQAALLLEAVVAIRSGVLVCGPMAAGKTAMLNALVRAMPPAHRVLGCEVTRELSAPLFHGDYFQTRQVGIGSKGETEVSLRDLVYQCLGMRADTLIVGEVRGPEAYELTRAGNAGSSLLCTIHANGPREAMNALVNTAVLAGENVPADQISGVFADIINLVVYLDREDLALRDATEGGPIRRQVMEISAVPPLQGSERSFTMEPLFVREDIGAPLRWTGVYPSGSLRTRLERALKAKGTTLDKLVEGRLRRAQ
jgi:pilus assembly protein CpaF